MKVDHDYYHQVQGQLHIMDKQCCDVIVWTDVDFVVVRVAADPLWIENIHKMIEFYFGPLLSRLLQ